MKTLFGIPLSEYTKEQLLQLVSDALSKHSQFIIFTPNPEILVHTFTNRQYRNLFTNGSINIADGVGITLFQKVPLLKGREIFSDLIELCSTKQYKVLLVGSTDRVIDKTLKKIVSEFPSLTVEGYAGPIVNQKGLPLDERDNDRENVVIDEIKRFEPHIVFVAMGAPKQEYWITRMRQLFPKVSFMAVGGTFDTYSGEKKLPPRWMSDSGLEWLFRLFIEPKRIKRIFTAVFVFPYFVFLSYLQKKG